MKKILEIISVRGWLYISLFALGAVLVATGVVAADSLMEWFLTVALAATAAGNLLARAFLEKPPGDSESD